MADFVSGINRVTPTYPVRPTQPANKDREPGSRKHPKEKPAPPVHEDGGDENPDDQTNTIDEHA